MVPGARHLAPILALLGSAWTSAPSGQELVWADGALGSSIDYSLQADPGELWVLGLSFNAGPTPLALVDPIDPRVLSLGLEFLFLWPSGTVPAEGSVPLSINLGSSPVLQGLVLHGQFLTLFGTATLVDDLSNPVSLRLQFPETSFPTVGQRSGQGTRHTQTPIDGGALGAPGRVFLAGGVDESGGSPVILDRTEIYLPQQQAFTVGPTLAEARTDHTATLLDDGRVLIVGGRSSSGALATCEIFDPLTDTLSAGPALPDPRSQHVAVRLADGRVLAVGGLEVDSPSDVVGSLLSAHLATALFSPVSSTWSSGPSLPTGLIGHTLTLLGDGRVLIAGGIEETSLFGFPVQTWTRRAWLFDPVTGGLSPAAPMPEARARHAALAPAGDGRALVIGGEHIEPFFLPTYDADVWRYETLSDSWSVLAPLTHARGYHVALESAGEIVVIGGVGSLSSDLLTEFAEPTAEVAPADVSAWGTPIALQAGRQRIRATAVDGGQRILVTGGPLGPVALNPTAETLLP
jgi:hypothetical protein